MSLQFVIGSGLLLGLASSLHCAGYCGAIALSLSPTVQRQPYRNTALDAAWTLSAPHIGRVGIYVVFGTLVGAAGGAFNMLLPFAELQSVARAVASVSLAWTGASIAGLLPASASPGRLLAMIGDLPFRAGLLSRHPISFGMAWACAPCAMVYSALLNASMTASPVGGAVFMLCFGLATIPPLISLSAGYMMARRCRMSGDARRVANKAIGVSLMGLACANAAVPASGFSSLLCLAV